MPNVSWSTFATGARQFVVHDAFEMMWCSAGLYISRLMPMHSVTSGFFAGAEIRTFFAPPARCLPALALSTNRPVALDHDVDAGVLPLDRRRILLGADLRRASPLITSAPSLISTVPGNLPCTESCLSRCAERLDVGQVVDEDEIERRRVRREAADEAAADATEAIDADANLRHGAHPRSDRARPAARRAADA